LPQTDLVTVEKLGLMIDNNSFVPYYMQIVDHVRELIKKKKLTQGRHSARRAKLPRPPDQQDPVRQAFQKLRAEGLLVIAKGKRPVIGSGRVPWNFQQLRGFMRRCGGEAHPSAACSAWVGRPELEVAQALKLTPGERCTRAGVSAR